ncbi:MAG: hypothetical protein RL213_750 [Bacteroidota bacterium]|jgi:TonB-linked SusC/RagA family outer membrane protein
MRQKLTLLALMLSVFALGVKAQDRTISGKVTSSEDQSTVPGVSVVVVGTTIGTSTDIDGNYKLTVPSTAKTLRFSGIGMKVKDIPLGASNTVDIVLDPDVLKLDEVVVTANEIVREKRSLGYSTQQVTSEDLTAGNNPNLIGALQGKVSGVNITSLSGAPGSAQRIVIRGGSSISRNNQALIVVDGIPVDNSNFRTESDLDNQVDYGNRGNDINPNDIESISVLKGPAAAALYGSRASNGVIMITTKRGKTGVSGKSKMEVTVNSNVTFSDVLKLPDFQNTYGQGDVDNVADDRRENFSWGLPFDGQLRPWGQEINGQMRVKPYEALPNNLKDFFNTGVAYNNNVSFSGGSEKSSYYLSVGALNSKGMVPTTAYDKYNLRFNGNTELANHFKSSISVNYSNVESNLPIGGQRDASVYNQLIQTPRDIPITEGKDLNDPFNRYDDIAGTYGFYGAYTVNPYFSLDSYKSKNFVDRMVGNFSVTYDGISWLSITNRFGGDVYSDRRKQSFKKYSYEALDPFYAFNDAITYNGKYSEDIYNLSSYNNDLMVTLKKELAKDLQGSLLLGQNVRQSTLTNLYAQTNPEGGLALPGFYNLENSNGPVTTYNSTTQSRNVGYYGELNLAYKNYLYLGFSGRNDYSSTLPESNNSYFYYGGNLSFIFSEFLPESLRENWWTYGKLRMSSAKVGNDAPPYATSNYYSKTVLDATFGGTTFPFDGVNGYTVGDRVGNPELRPEFSTESEVGVDLGFLDDRLSLGVTYYNKSSTDQILSLPTSNATGFTSKTINTGEMVNSGFEVDLRAVPVSTSGGLKVELYTTFFKNNNEVRSLYEGVDQLALGGTSRTAIVAQVGQSYGAFYAIDLLRDPSGNVVVDSSTGMPMTTPNLVYCGSYMPKWQGSFGATVSYKNWSFNFLIDRKEGGKFYSRTKDLMDFVGTAKETENRTDYVWEGSVYMGSDGTYHPNSTPFHPYDYYTSVIPDGQHIIDASYTKLREVGLSYRLPSKYLNKLPFGSVTFGLFANNVFIWTPAENQYADPEQNSSGASNTQGFEFSSNPSQRNYGFDLKFTF